MTALLVVLGGSQPADERRTSSLRIAEEPVLDAVGPIQEPASMVPEAPVVAGIAPIQQPAIVLPTALRAVEGEVVTRRRVSTGTARQAPLLPE